MRDGRKNPVSEFFGWWSAELLGLLPQSEPSRAGPRSARTVIALDKSRLEVIEERGRVRRVVVSVDNAGEGGFAAILPALERRPSKQPVGIRVPREACFSRSLTIPAAARSDAAALADLDLERSTPFRAPDVLTAVEIDGPAAAAGKVKVRQHVLKRETVRPLLAALEARGIAPEFIDCWSEGRISALPLDFLARGRAAGTARKAPIILRRTLAAAAVGGLAAAGMLLYVKHENAVAMLEREVAAKRHAAQAVGEQLAASEAAIAAAARIRGLATARPSVLAMVEEVTRLLPDNAYLLEFNLEGTQLDIAGLAKSAAPLLEAFQRSRHFTDASFTSPFRFEPREERERFAMRVRVRAEAHDASAPNLAQGSVR